MLTLLTKDNVKYAGRTLLQGDVLFLSLSGSGVAFEYEGRGLTLTLQGGCASEIPDNQANYARIAVYVDEERVCDLQLSKPKTILRVAESAVSKKSLILSETFCRRV